MHLHLNVEMLFSECEVRVQAGQQIDSAKQDNGT